uniref:Uncharacterized protein n=1 Tax=Ditylenchus dipsaci TaxID=166011 RepID=A0A915EKI0_9BILA
MHSISSDEELDENLFGAYFEGTINKSKTCPEVFNEVLDKQMTYLLSYWLPIGSRTDYCLNLAVANDLLETSVMLLVSRRFVENISNQISMILNLSNSYQIEAKETSACNTQLTNFLRHKLEVILWVCFQRISKSFLIFDCGHLAHIECCPEQRNQRKCGVRMLIDPPYYLYNPKC